MDGFLDLFARNRKPTLIVSLVYYLMVVLLHEEVSKISVYLQKTLSIKRYNTLISITLIISGLFLLLLILKRAKRNGKDWRWYLYLPVTAGLMVVSYHTLLVVNVESIHFFQYALLALPFYALTGSYGQSILWITLLGAIDEGYQYFFLYPDWKYLDFNDIILNLLGGAAGLMFILLTTSKETNRAVSHIFSGRVPLVIGLIIILTLVPFITGLAGVTADDGDKNPHRIVLLREKPPNDFWIEMKWGKRYHILSPVEGTVLTVILIGFYALLDIRRGKS